ncbi:MAG: dipeptide epimerase [Cytophagales bacterium]|nr:dipeptide epimerase [Cytophagales bacterium]
MQLIIHERDLKLKHTFRIAHDVREVQETVIVELRDNEIAGYGEATASNYYDRPRTAIIKALEENRALIESYDYSKPSEFWMKLKDAFQASSFALCAVDVAIHDLYARKQGKSLTSLWAFSGKGPNTNYTIGIDSVEKMVEKMLEFPWPLYKVKLGTREDLEIMKSLRAKTRAQFRVDANCGWTAEETLANAAALKEMGVEFIEQPLRAGDWEGMKMLFKQSPLPLIADESCIAESDVNSCAGYFHGVNIKLMKCGGLTPALRMIRQAKTLGLKVMVGCMTESSVGISAIGQLLPQLDYVDMDGFLLIENDPGKGPWIKDDQLHMPTTPGTGVTFIG